MSLPSRRPLRVGLVGAHYGAAMHAPVYAALPETELVAVATAAPDTAAAAAARLGGIRPVTGFQELCAAPDVDLVDVAVRPSLHREMVLAALAAGKSVVCEAPLAPDAATGAELVAAAARSPGTAVVDLQGRYVPALGQLRRLVHAGWLGRVENVVVTALYPTFTRPERNPGSLWCADRGSGASSLRVHGLHTADLLRWIFGEVVGVCGAVATARPVWPAPGGPLPATSADSSAFVLRLAGGALCSVHTSWVAWHGAGWSLTAHGSAGVLVAAAAGHPQHHTVSLRGARADDAALVEIAPDAAEHDVTEVASDAPTYAFARLVRALAGGGDAERLPDLGAGAAGLRVADAVEESSRDGRWVSLA